MADQPFRLRRDGVSIDRLAMEPVVVVRIRSGDAAAGRVSAAIGQDLPVAPNSVTRGAAGVICWLSPGEWAIVGVAADIPAIAAAIVPVTGHVADAGEGRVRYRIEGDLAACVLAKGTSLDLATALSDGRCAQTLFAQILVLLTRCGEQAYELMADVTYAHYLDTWFEDATREFTQGAGAW